MHDRLSAGFAAWLIALGLLQLRCGPVSAPGSESSSESSSESQPGYLVGHVTIGPLQPVARAGVPAPTPPPEVCTSRGLVIYAADGGAEIARFALQPDCTYSVSLPPDTYRIELDRRGIDNSKDLPHTVTIAAGQTTQFDFSIDTGIR